jgi:TIR domain
LGNQSEAPSPRRLRVFLCHAVEDKPAVRNLYQQLEDCNIDSWLDEKNILPGQDWEYEIRRAVRNVDAVIVCLSHKSINKTGFVHKELKLVLDEAAKRPEGTIFIIPLRLEDCDLPERLKPYQAVDYFVESGFDRVILALKHQSESLKEKILPIDCQPSTRANQSQVENSRGQPDYSVSPPLISMSTRPRLAESSSLQSSISGSTQRIKQRKIYIIVSLLIAIILILATFFLYNTVFKAGTSTSPTPSNQSTTVSSIEPSGTFGFEHGIEHWIAPEADFKPSKVDVTTDRVHSGSHALRLTTVLIGNGNDSFPGQEYYMHSEATVYFDRPLPGLSAPGPYNLTGKPVSCFVYLPAALAAENTPQAFIRMSVKDRGAANDYGPMVFIDSSHVEQWFQLSLTIGKGGYPDKTFDPKRVWSIVVLLQTTENSTLSFKGSIYIDDCFVGHT